MSSISFTNRRQWANQHQNQFNKNQINNNQILTKKDLLINSTITDKNNLICSTNRSKFSLLQKQLSVDQIYSKKFNPINTNYNKNLRSTSRLNQRKHLNEFNNNLNKSNLNDSQWIINGEKASSSELSIVSTNNNNNNNNNNNSNNNNSTCNNNSNSSNNDINSNSYNKKKYFQISNGYGDNKKEKSLLNERPKKSIKGLEDKVNLNIFLNQSVNINDIDGNSDAESLAESTKSELKEKNITAEKVTTSGVTKSVTIINSRKPFSASIRRAQFQASRENSTNVSTSSNHLQISASPSLTIERRPPLARAMSAPIRSLDENSKNILANKRKSRRRKILSRTPSCEGLSNKIIETVTTQQTKFINDSDENNNKNCDLKNINKKALNRTRSAFSSDVVTLVSLISSEGSDSEKEEPIVKSESPVKRAPTLRKTGKSVSFQENDIPTFCIANKEFIRRGSVARVKKIRPPTAPASSIFSTDFENRKLISEKLKSSSKEDLTVKMSEDRDIKENSSEKNTTIEDNQFPDYVRSIKERECWKLFQKMCNKNVNVSYDTILRGMLTPTEFRQLQKQREIEEALKAKLEENEEKNQ